MNEEKQINDGGPAFPWQMNGFLQCGMSLRDYFAGRAMTANIKRGCGMDLNDDDFAASCYQLADAMLRAGRDKR